MSGKSSRWLVTGAAGFIGSHLVEQLLRDGHEVVGLDNFVSGFKKNLDEVRASVGPEKARNFQFIEGDIVDLEQCRAACRGVTYVLHQAARGSVPRSFEDPIDANRVNVNGALNVFVAAREAGVSRVVYASSSSVYGDDPSLPKVETRTGRQLSPYAVSKFADESYAHTFAMHYRMSFVGLRYFNVFGPRQDPNGPYAAVIPKWIEALFKGKPCVIFGDGETSRDFCFVQNVVEANIRAALSEKLEPATSYVFNVALGGRTTLNELYRHLVAAVRATGIETIPEPKHEGFRAGDVRHSQADIAQARSLIGYEPRVSLPEGLTRTVQAFGNLS